MLNKYLEMNAYFKKHFGSRKKYHYLCLPILLSNDKKFNLKTIMDADYTMKWKFNSDSVFRGDDSIVYNTFLSLENEMPEAVDKVNDAIILLSDYFYNMYTAPYIPFINKDINEDTLIKAKSISDKMGFNDVEEYLSIFAPLYVLLVKSNLDETTIINEVKSNFESYTTTTKINKVFSLFLSLVCCLKRVDTSKVIDRTITTFNELLNKKIKINKDLLPLFGIYCIFEEDNNKVIESIESVYNTLVNTKGFKKKTCMLDTIVINLLNFDDKSLLLSTLIIFEGITTNENSFYLNTLTSGHYGR